MKTAIVADWLPTYAGAEHVIAELTKLWPNAPVYTTIARHGHLGPLDACAIHTTGLQKWYRLLGTHKVLLPWMPKAMEGIDLRGYDLIISSSHAVGKGIVPPSNAVHVCYCHTPMRYAWEMEQEYIQDFSIPKMLRRRVRQQLKRLRRWDLTTAKRVDVFIANSSATQERIRRTYGRDSIVIPPPVEEQFFSAPLRTMQERSASYLAIGRLVPYKRFDLLIQTANEQKIPLKIAGTGQDAERLQRMAGPTVEILGFVPNEKLAELYTNAKALLFPQMEDAGVVPLEAQACGTPVIAYGKGGIVDTVQEGETGVFFPEQKTASLYDAIQKFEQRTWDPETIRNHAKQFSVDAFRSRMTEGIDAALAKKR